MAKMRLNWIWITAIAVMCLLLVSCGGGLAPTAQQVTGDGEQAGGKTGRAPGLETESSSRAALDETLAELDALETPESVDAELFSELKGALQDALLQTVGARHAVPLREKKAGGEPPPYRLVSKPPAGPANRVTDLVLIDNGDGTFALAWSYKNSGDYNQDGVVNIQDITPLAVHFQEEAAPTNEWIDGNADGVINIQDITPLAAGFAADCAGYRVQGESAGLNWEEVAEVPLSQASDGGGRLRFEYQLGVPNHDFFRVVPYDARGVAGVRSVVVPESGSQPPSIQGVSPRGGVSGDVVTFSAAVQGSVPFTFAWDFGGGSAPNLSTEPSPTVTLGETGEYDAELTVTNAFGWDVYTFALIVGEPAVPVGWVHTWGGSGDDTAYAIAADAEGNVFVTGWTETAGQGENDLLLLKYSADGNLTWRKTWGTEGWDGGYAIALNDAGAIYVVGQTDDTAPPYGEQVLLLKYDANGALLWQRTWGQYYGDFAFDIALDGNGGFYVAGSTEQPIDGARDYGLLLKYDADGNLLWQKSWARASFYAMALDESGNIFVVGDVGPEDSNVLLLKTDVSGSVIWQRAWDAGSEDIATGLALDAEGNIYVTGGSYSFGTGEYPDVFLLKFNADGNLVWQRAWGGSYADAASSVVMAGNGSVYVAGLTGDFSDFLDLLLLEYATDGELISQKSWRGSNGSAANALAVNGNGLVLLAGSGANANGSWGDAGGGTIFPEGEVSKPQKEESVPVGEPGVPVGQEASPTGVADDGGGGDDVLVIGYSVE